MKRTALDGILAKMGYTRLNQGIIELWNGRTERKRRAPTKKWRKMFGRRCGLEMSHLGSNSSFADYFQTLCQLKATLAKETFLQTTYALDATKRLKHWIIVSWSVGG